MMEAGSSSPLFVLQKTTKKMPRFPQIAPIYMTSHTWRTRKLVTRAGCICDYGLIVKSLKKKG